MKEGLQRMMESVLFRAATAVLSSQVVAAMAEMEARSRAELEWQALGFAPDDAADLVTACVPLEFGKTGKVRAPLNWTEIVEAMGWE